MSLLLTPVIGFGGHLVVISMLCAGVLTGLVSVGLRHWTSDYISMERARLLQRSYQVQMNDARIKGDVDRMSRLRKAQPHILSRTMEHQPAMKAPTIMTMFFAIAVFWWLSVFLDPVSGPVRVTSVSLPWASSWPLHASFPWPPLPYWIALYSVMSLPITLAFGAALKLWRFHTVDVQAPLKAMPTVEEILERVDEGVQDEETVDREAERARRRLKGKPAAAVEETAEDEVEIVDAPDGEIEDADEGVVTIVETKVKAAPPARVAHHADAPSKGPSGQEDE
jgi:uncharacterized membrane protein (DUF106 family)